MKLQRDTKRKIYVRLWFWRKNRFFLWWKWSRLVVSCCRMYRWTSPHDRCVPMNFFRNNWRCRVAHCIDKHWHLLTSRQGWRWSFTQICIRHRSRQEDPKFEYQGWLHCQNMQFDLDSMDWIADIYLLKVYNRNSSTFREINSK